LHKAALTLFEQQKVKKRAGYRSFLMADKIGTIRNRHREKN